MLVGLTGQIGAGKSTVAAVFKSEGAVIIDADQIGRQVVEDKPALQRQLVRAFGKGILNRFRRIDRSKLAEAAFTNAETTSRLNALVHPHLLRELWRQARWALKRDRVVVIDAALLHYWKLDYEMNVTVVVGAPRAIRHRRMRIRGISTRDAGQRERMQTTYAEMKRRSSVLITNGGSLKDLKRRAQAVWRTKIAPGVDR